MLSIPITLGRPGDGATLNTVLLMFKLDMRAVMVIVPVNAGIEETPLIVEEGRLECQPR